MDQETKDKLNAVCKGILKQAEKYKEHKKDRVFLDNVNELIQLRKEVLLDFLNRDTIRTRLRDYTDYETIK